MSTLTSYLNKYYCLQDKILLVYRPKEKSNWRTRCFFLDERYNPFTKYNHRSILTNEVIIEYDLEDKSENRRLVMEVGKRLDEDKISYSIWYSGNKSFHLHCLLDIKKANNLALLKKTFIRHYTKGLLIPDLRLCSGNHLIRAEYGIHEKTQVKKVLIKRDAGYPSISSISDEIWVTYVKEIRNSINRRISYREHSITELPGFKYILKSHEFRECEDGRERALFMLIHILKDDYKDKREEFIKFLQDWYKYSGGFNLSEKQIAHKIYYHWTRTYHITENYLNELLESIGKSELIVKSEDL